MAPRSDAVTVQWVPVSQTFSKWNALCEAAEADGTRARAAAAKQTTTTSRNRAPTEREVIGPLLLGVDAPNDRDGLAIGTAPRGSDRDGTKRCRTPGSLPPCRHA